MPRAASAGRAPQPQGQGLLQSGILRAVLLTVAVAASAYCIDRWRRGPLSWSSWLDAKAKGKTPCEHHDGVGEGRKEPPPQQSHPPPGDHHGPGAPAPDAAAARPFSFDNFAAGFVNDSTRNWWQNSHARRWASSVTDCFLPGFPACDEGTVVVPGDPDKGFHWEYFLHVPRWLREQKGRQGQPARLLVAPNDTPGGSRHNDTIARHRENVRFEMMELRTFAAELGVAALIPVFPRKRGGPYSHALDRGTLLESQPGWRRIDLQLLAMAADAAEQASRRWGVTVDPSRLLMMGYSASGMFVSRFAALHPKRVAAGVIGFPGSSPWIPPPSDWPRNHRWYDEYVYPIGAADFKEATGADFDRDAYRKVRLHFFIGDDDSDDILAFDKHYTDDFRARLRKRFGHQQPRRRYAECLAAHRAAGHPAANFYVYPGVGHRFTPLCKADVTGFFKSELHPGEPPLTGPGVGANRLPEPVLPETGL